MTAEKSPERVTVDWRTDGPRIVSWAPPGIACEANGTARYILVSAVEQREKTLREALMLIVTPIEEIPRSKAWRRQYVLRLEKARAALAAAPEDER